MEKSATKASLPSLLQWRVAVVSLSHERSPLPRNTSSGATSASSSSPTMASTPPPVSGKAGNFTVFITPPATLSPADTPRSRSPESPRSDFSTPNATPRAAATTASPPPEQPTTPPPEQPTTPPPVKTASPPPPQVATTPPVSTVSPPLPAAKLSSPTPTPTPVQVPPPQFEKAGARPDGSVFAFFWDAVVRMQEAHASLDEYISNWFGLDQSKYQWAVNDYYESTGKEMDLGKAGKPKELSSKMQKV